MNCMEIAKKIHQWAFSNTEGLDEPELSFCYDLCFVTTKYMTKKINMQHKKKIDTSKYDENIEF